MVLTACGAHSQVYNDTVCIPAPQLRKALVLIEEGKITRLELTQAQGQNRSLVEQVRSKAAVITALDKQVALLEGQKSTLEQLNENYLQQKNALLLREKSLVKQYKKQRFKTAVAGVLGAGFFLLYILK